MSAHKEMKGTSARKAALEEVERYVCSDRQNAHGDAEDNFAHTAQLWSAYLGQPIDPLNVAAMMVLFKMSRQRACPTFRDNWIDAAGYAVCGAGIAAKISDRITEKVMAAVIQDEARVCANCTFFLHTKYPLEGDGKCCLDKAPTHQKDTCDRHEPLGPG